MRTQVHVHHVHVRTACHAQHAIKPHLKHGSPVRLIHAEQLAEGADLQTRARTSCMARVVQQQQHPVHGDEEVVYIVGIYSGIYIVGHR